MVFNFYINGQPDDKPNPILEEIMKKLEIHFADWEDFYQYYMKTAKPPEKNVKRIQQIFGDLRNDFVEILKEYNNKINHFADIQEVDKHLLMAILMRLSLTIYKMLLKNLQRNPAMIKIIICMVNFYSGNRYIL